MRLFILVSSSVPYLPAEKRVSVVDNTGALLTDTEGENAMTLTTAQAEHKRSLETSYNRRMKQILATIVGLVNVRSEVDVTLDFTEVETTYEEFDKAGVGPRTRSESLDFEQEAAIGALVCPAASIKHLPRQTSQRQAICARQWRCLSTGVSSSSTTRNYEFGIRVKQQVAVSSASSPS